MNTTESTRISVVKTDVLHCFGFSSEHYLSARDALELLRIARNPWITLYFDRRPPSAIRYPDELAVGHAGLLFRDLREAGAERDLFLLTTDKAKCVEEAVEMAGKASLLPVNRTKIKLEVLCAEETRPINKLVVEAVAEILARSPEIAIWPMINYCEEDVRTLERLGVEAIRVLRGPIGCNGAITDLPDLKQLGRLGRELETPIILEGGIGDEIQVYEALKTAGIEAVLVNSCLFRELDEEGTVDPQGVMRSLRHAADLVRAGRPFHRFSRNCALDSEACE